MRIEIQLLCLLLPIASALPRKHGALETCSFGSCARFAQASITIDQKRSGNLGYAIIESRENEQFIPENVALVSFPSPSACRDTNVEFNGVYRYGLQQVEHVQTKHHLNVEPELGTCGFQIYV